MAIIRYNRYARENVAEVKVCGVEDLIVLASKDGRGKVDIFNTKKLDPNMYALKVVIRGNVKKCYFSNCASVWGNVDVANAGNCIFNEGTVLDCKGTFEVDKTFKCRTHEEEYREYFRKECKIRNKIIHIDGDLDYLLVSKDIYNISVIIEIRGDVHWATCENSLSVKGIIKSAKAGNRTISTDGKSIGKRMTRKDLQKYNEGIDSMIRNFIN